MMEQKIEGNQAGSRGRQLLCGAVLGVALAVGLAPAEAATDKRAVLDTYADIAQATYEDALATAKSLQQAIAALGMQPSEATLKAARAAWLKARDPYMQSEAFRFGNPVVDDWEGKVNAWPLDEGLIDYVAASYGEASDGNLYYTANVIANPKLELGAETIDASTITPALLETLQEAGGVEANVATGYHAIEFLLWGQDLNGTGPGAGARPASDFASGAACTNGNCARRVEYLKAASQLLIDDLTWIVAEWAPGGEARDTLLKGDADAGIAAMLTGLGSLSYGELAGERMKLGLLLHDPEEEHDCFSDNTHNSHYYDVVGMMNVFNGQFVRLDGSKVSGPSLSDLLAEKDAAVERELGSRLEATEQGMLAIKRRAEGGESYDQMIGPDNPEGNAVVQAAIVALTAQTKAIEAAVAVLALEPIAFEGSDSLDNPEAVFQ
ncbi:MAG: imelysin family protein [Kiloniellales bacterium]